MQRYGKPYRCGVRMASVLIGLSFLGCLGCSGKIATSHQTDPVAQQLPPPANEPVLGGNRLSVLLTNLETMKAWGAQQIYNLEQDRKGGNQLRYDEAVKRLQQQLTALNRQQVRYVTPVERVETNRIYVQCVDVSQNA